MDSSSAPWSVVQRQGELEEALQVFDFSHAFVREVSAVSPSILLPDDSVIAAESPSDVRIVIVTQGSSSEPTGGGDENHAAVELHLHEADSVHVPLLQDLDVTTEVRATQVWLSLGSNAPRMEGRALRWRFLSRVEAEATGRYGRTFPSNLQDDPRLWEPRVNWRGE